MQPFSRLACRAARAPRQPSMVPAIVQPRRLAHQSSGNDRPGAQQDRDQKNPKSHHEDPGPDAAASKGGADKSSSSSQPSTPDTSHEGSMKIHRHVSAAEKNDPEVRKHNEEMEQRKDRSVNQLSEEDNKVDKNFWKGDVGPKKGSQ